jgi:acyl-CoA synthetase (AMP-forming)/AMP-acid ligase II
MTASTTRAQTVHAAFAATAARTPDAPFLCVEAVTAATYGIRAGEISWREAARQVDALRARYASAGYGHGHRVGLMLENRPAFPVPLVRAQRARRERRADQCRDALGRARIPGRAQRHRARGRAAGPQATTCTSPANACGVPLRRPRVARGRRRARPASPHPLPTALRPVPRAGQAIGLDTECALLYTSGTTGRPKGCMLSNAYFLNVGRWYADIGDVCSVRPDRNASSRRCR